MGNLSVLASTRSRLALLGAVLLVLALPASGSAAPAFTHGVAAGEVTKDSARLWAKATQPGDVRVELARDSDFEPVDRKLRPSPVSSSSDLTIHRVITQLRPGTRYWYRFISAAGTSEVGTFVTAPKLKENAVIRFGWTGDYDAETLAGETEPFWNDFEIFERMQEEAYDFNVLLGDTIYSDSEVPGRLNPVALRIDQKWRKYRRNLAQEPLADLRGSAAVYSHWDDHEFVNDFSRAENVFSSATIDGELLYQRGVKAFTDYAPVDYTKKDGLYRTHRWGRNVELFFLDERSFRSAKASKDGVCDNPESGNPDVAPTAPQRLRDVFSFVVPELAEPIPQECLDEINDPNRTFLGGRQLRTFLHDVKNSKARFKVIVNEMPIQQYYVLPYDRWEGYEYERQKVLEALQDVSNVVFITTDVHATLVNDARFQTLEPGGPINSGILDVTVGPAATAPFGLEIEDATGVPGAGGLVDAAFLEPQPPNGVGMQCSILDQFSYGEVEVTRDELTITPKGIDGAPQTSADGPCGPFVIPYQP
jgi:alkaline phosphatase D